MTETFLSAAHGTRLVELRDAPPGRDGECESRSARVARQEVRLRVAGGPASARGGDGADAAGPRAPQRGPEAAQPAQVVAALARAARAVARHSLSKRRQGERQSNPDSAQTSPLKEPQKRAARDETLNPRQARHAWRALVQETGGTRLRWCVVGEERVRRRLRGRSAGSGVDERVQGALQTRVVRRGRRGLRHAGLVRRAARVRAQRRVHCSAVLCRQTHERVAERAPR